MKNLSIPTLIVLMYFSSTLQAAASATVAVAAPAKKAADAIAKLDLARHEDRITRAYQLVEAKTKAKDLYGSDVYKQALVHKDNEALFVLAIWDIFGFAADEKQRAAVARAQGNEKYFESQYPKKNDEDNDFELYHGTCEISLLTTYITDYFNIVIAAFVRENEALKKQLKSLDRTGLPPAAVATETSPVPTPTPAPAASAVAAGSESVPVPTPAPLAPATASTSAPAKESSVAKLDIDTHEGRMKMAHSLVSINPRGLRYSALCAKALDKKDDEVLLILAVGDIFGVKLAEVTKPRAYFDQQYKDLKAVDYALDAIRISFNNYFSIQQFAGMNSNYLIAVFVYNSEIAKHDLKKFQTKLAERFPRSVTTTPASSPTLASSATAAASTQPSTTTKKAKKGKNGNKTSAQTAAAAEASVSTNSSSSSSSSTPPPSLSNPTSTKRSTKSAKKKARLHEVSQVKSKNDELKNAIQELVQLRKAPLSEAEKQECNIGGGDQTLVAIQKRIDAVAKLSAAYLQEQEETEKKRQEALKKQKEEQERQHEADLAQIRRELGAEEQGFGEISASAAAAASAMPTDSQQGGGWRTVSAPKNKEQKKRDRAEQRAKLKQKNEEENRQILARVQAGSTSRAAKSPAAVSASSNSSTIAEQQEAKRKADLAAVAEQRAQDEAARKLREKQEAAERAEQALAQVLQQAALNEQLQKDSKSWVDMDAQLQQQSFF